VRLIVVRLKYGQLLMQHKFCKTGISFSFGIRVDEESVKENAVIE
jgi:hypothetical protein